MFSSPTKNGVKRPGVQAGPVPSIMLMILAANSFPMIMRITVHKEITNPITMVLRVRVTARVARAMVKVTGKVMERATGKATAKVKESLVTTDRKIRIKIDAIGNPEIDAIGFHGQGCKDATKLLEQALSAGADNVETTTKPEWNELEDEVNIQETHTGW